jgi:hypothetical protein
LKIDPTRAVARIALVAGFTLGLFAPPSLAIISPCDVAGGTTFKPAHPQAKDILTFDIELFTVRPTADVVLSKSTLSTGNKIQFDVVFAPPDAVSMFGTYQSFSPLLGEMIEGSFGSLPVGEYAVTTSLHQFDPATGLTSRCGDKQGTLIVYSAIGLSIGAIGLVGVVAPSIILDIGRSLLTPAALYAVAALRIGIGAVLVRVASASRLPTVLRIVGIVIIIAGVLTLFLGVERSRAILDWWANQGSAFMRFCLIGPMAVGLFIVYALTSPRRTAA